MGGTRVAIGFGLGLALACQPSGGAFECTTDAQCGADGTCQPTEFCSFPDTTCPSEQRYGGLAGDGLSDSCVPEGAGGTSTGSTSSVAGSTGAETTTSATSAAVTSDSTGSAAVSGIGSVDSSTAGDTTGGTTGDTSDTEGPDPVSLVVWYRFENVVDGVVPDSSGNEIDGTCAACGELVSGVDGSALEFGTASNIVVADHDDALENAGVTVAAWISVNAIDCMSIASKPLAGADLNSWQLYTCPNATETMDLVGYIPGGGQSSFVTTYAAVDGEFVHVAMTFSGEVIRLYVNGAQQLSMQLEHDMQFDDSPLVVGGEDNGAGLVFPFQGALDDVRIYSGALSSDEVAALFAGR